MCICWKESLAQRAAHSNHINKISNDDVDNIAYNIFHLQNTRQTYTQYTI